MKFGLFFLNRREALSCRQIGGRFMICAIFDFFGSRRDKVLVEVMLMWRKITALNIEDRR